MVPYRASVHRSDDQGDFWYIASRNLPSDVDIACLAVSPVDPDVVFAGLVDYHGIYRSVNGGASWRRSDVGIDARHVLAIAFHPAATEVTDLEVVERDSSWIHEAGEWWWMDSGGGYVKVHADDWAQWWPPGSARPDLPSPQKLETKLIAADHGTGSVVYLWIESYGFNALYRSDDRGVNYTSIGAFFDAVDAVVDPADDYRVFALTGDSGERVKLSTDGGVAWSARSAGLPSGTPVSLLMNRTDGDHLLAVFADAGLYESTDGGMTWAAVPVDLQGATITHADWDGEYGRAYLATEQDGIYVIGIGFVNEGLYTRSFTAIEYSICHETLIVGTKWGGAWARWFPRGVGAPDVARTTAHRPDLTVGPNPFSTRTTIRFGLPDGGLSTRLAVFDAGGRRIRTLIDGARPAGPNSEIWNGRDDSGNIVSAGVYFLRLEVGGGSDDAARASCAMRSEDDRYVA
jgi:hypothetical protein